MIIYMTESNNILLFTKPFCFLNNSDRILYSVSVFGDHYYSTITASIIFQNITAPELFLYSDNLKLKFVLTLLTGIRITGKLAESLI